MTAHPSRGQLAIDGGKPAKTIPYGTAIRFGSEEEEAAVAAIRSQKLWYIGGTRVLAAEARIRSLYGVGHAIACSSGTAAVHTALAVCGVEPGDEVIVNPVSDWGSVAGVLALGAVPVFADIEVATYSLDPAAVEAAITPRTRAVMVVHMSGYPARIQELAALAKRHALKLVEDCAQAHYTFVGQQVLGSFGDVGAFSTNDSKHISCGEGGFVVLADPEVAKVARLFTDKGYDRDQIKTRGAMGVPFLAYNYRMSELSASVLDVQLAKMPKLIEDRRRYAEALLARISDIPGYIPLPVPPASRPSYWTVLGRIDPAAFRVARTTLVGAMDAEGVGVATGLAPSRVLYGNPVFTRKALHPMSPDKPAAQLAGYEYRLGLCPVAEHITDTAFNLPTSPYFTERDAEETASALRKVLTHFQA
jgi:perosamine synthetase